MPLHPLAARFAGLAEEYERGRPGYPPAVTAALTAELGLAPGARVLDLAAGTGKLTRALAHAGLAVAAVEPQERLRAVLATHLDPARIHDGVAEAIPFADAAFDAVTVADAFHWFDQEPALAEIGRVLRPGGGLALITAVPDWSPEIADLVHEARTEHPFFDGPRWAVTLAAAAGWAAPREVRVTTRQRLDMSAYVGSMSWVAALEPAAREALLDRVRALAPGTAELPVQAVMTLSARA